LCFQDIIKTVDPFLTFENQKSLIRTVGFVDWDDLERCHVYLMKSRM